MNRTPETHLERQENTPSNMEQVIAVHSPTGPPLPRPDNHEPSSADTHQTEDQTDTRLPGTGPDFNVLQREEAPSIPASRSNQEDREQRSTSVPVSRPRHRKQGNGAAKQPAQPRNPSKRKASTAQTPKQPRKRQRSLASAMATADPIAQDAVDRSATVPDVAGSAGNRDARVTGVRAARGRKSSPTAAALPQLYVEKLVAYSPSKESWLSSRLFEDAGSAYIIGRVSRFDKKKALFQIHWLDTQFQKDDKWVSLSMVQRGMDNYKNVMTSPSKPAWRSLCREDSSEVEIVENDSDLEEVEESFERYNPEVILPSSLPEVESIRNMNFDPNAHIEGPQDLFQHPDATTKTRIRPQFRHLFEHSATSSFFAYIPVYYWVEVLHQTNKAMSAMEKNTRVRSSKPFTLTELMTFFGILFFMKVVDKGEYANYWGKQVEDCIVGGNHTGLDSVMTLSRFKLLRQHFCFRHIPNSASAAPPGGSDPVVSSNRANSDDAEVPIDIDEFLNASAPDLAPPVSGQLSARDQASEAPSAPPAVAGTSEQQHVDPVRRIRTLLNMLKITGGRYVEVGRDVSLDEASVACRTKFGRKLIMFNPMKPGGKYHFRIYMLCCATSWIAINFRVHCESDLSERLQGVVTPEAIASFQEEMDALSVIRGQVMEVVRPLYHTNRVVNADNYYMSVQLLAALRFKGLYGRGTVRANSLHFPHHVVLKKNECRRGQYRQGVSVAHQMVAVSWFDSAVVKMVSNADSSSETALTRRVGSRMQPFEAPSCVSQYNANMQGVDRLDQLRGRFSLADGHTFKKWYKKLGMAIVDVARVNAYMSRKLTVDMSKDRDPHRSFVVQLAQELISGKWMEAPSDSRMFYSARGEESVGATIQDSAMWQCGAAEPVIASSPQKVCVAVNSKQLFEKTKRRRHCVVCRWEGRFPTVVTDHCTLHCVSLCQIVHTTASKPYFCQQPTWTCWEKYHKFYLAQDLFSAKGNLRKTSSLFQQRSQAEIDTTAQQQASTPETHQAVV